MISTSAGRVSKNTADWVNEEIQEATEQRIEETVARGPIAVHRRLRDLDQEWDIERTLEANAASIMLLGLGLGVAVDRRFLLLPAAVAGFLLQHAVQGWCPPLPIFRRMGIRTSREIENERHALKAIRGDYAGVARSEPLNPREAELALGAACR